MPTPSSKENGGGQTLALTKKAALVKFTDELKQARRTGNLGATTAAGLRVAMASFDAWKVSTYLLDEMGISSRVEMSAFGITIAFLDHHSFATVLRCLQGSFSVLAAMNEQGQMAIQIFRFKEEK